MSVHMIKFIFVSRIATNLKENTLKESYCYQSITVIIFNENKSILSN